MRILVCPRSRKLSWKLLRSKKSLRKSICWMMSLKTMIRSLLTSESSSSPSRFAGTSFHLTGSMNSATLMFRRSLYFSNVVSISWNSTEDAKMSDKLRSTTVTYQHVAYHSLSRENIRKRLICPPTSGQSWLPLCFSIRSWTPRHAILLLYLDDRWCPNLAPNASLWWSLAVRRGLIRS